MHQLSEPTDWFERQQSRRQALEPYKFVLKLTRRRGAGGWRPTPDAAHMGVQDFAAVHSAAEFAWYFGMSLDWLVTIDFARLGIDDPGLIRRELNRFLKGYCDWAAERGFPSGWIYAIEMAPDGSGCHAHIAVFVPGADEVDPGGEVRKSFRNWVSGYTGRNFGRHVPRAVLARGGLKIAAHRHWRVVTYLVKGYDPAAVVQSERDSLDQTPVYLGDLIPWPYSNPGPVPLANRVRVSHSLGPKRRELGVPTGLDHLLPHRPDWSTFRVDGRYDLAPGGKYSPAWFTMPKPFRSRYEDGHRDVRSLYPAEFYEMVTKQKPYMIEYVEETPQDELRRQLEALT